MIEARRRSAHRLSLCSAALAAVAITTGAYIASAEIVARQTHVTAATHQAVHLVFGGALLALVIGAAAGSRSVLAWTGAGALMAAVVSGWRGAPLSPGMGVTHALLAQLIFAITVIMAITTSEHWRRPAELADVPTPMIRPLAFATPPVVFMQIALGALYRHEVIEVVLHVVVAAAVALLALILCSVILQNYTRPASLKRAAGMLIGLVLTQVALGIASLVMLLLNFSATEYFIAATVAHVLVGAAVLAASIVTAMEVWRSVPRLPDISA